MIHSLSNGNTIKAAEPNALRLPTTQQRFSMQIQAPASLDRVFVIRYTHYAPLLTVIREEKKRLNNKYCVI